MKVGMALYIIYIGFSFCLTIQLHQAYGTYFIEAGAGCIMLGLLSGFLITPSFWYGLKRHNRAVILACFIGDTIIMACLLHLGTTTFTYLQPEFDPELQLECVRNDYDPIACKDYLESDRTSGFRLVWAYMFSLRDDARQHQILDQLQKDSTCCGFFPPFSCTEITASFPPDRISTGVDSHLASQRLTCGPEPMYYPPVLDEGLEGYCKDLSDPKPPGIVGGCRYDLAVGDYCIAAGVIPETSGCIDAVERYVASLITTHVYSLYHICPLFNIIGMILTFCMFFKRKREDIFPELFSDAKSVNYFKVKDQFEAKPSRNSLKLNGFVQLTATDKLREEHAGNKDEEENKEADKMPV